MEDPFADDFISIDEMEPEPTLTEKLTAIAPNMDIHNGNNTALFVDGSVGNIKRSTRVTDDWVPIN